jgi:hypothetical protein
MAVQVHVAMSQPHGMDTSVRPCWASPCSGPPCCNPKRASSPALICAPRCESSITQHAVASPTHDGPTRWDTLVRPCWASPCSGPPCCNPVQGGYRPCTKPVKSRYKVGTKPAQGGTTVEQRWYKGGTKRYKRGTSRYKGAQCCNRKRLGSASPAHTLCTTRHNDPAKRYLGVAVVGVGVGASVAPGRVGAGVVGMSVGLSVVGVAEEGVAVLGTAVLHRTLTHSAQPWLAPR